MQPSDARLEGYYYAAGRSQRRPAVLTQSGEGLVLEVDGESELIMGSEVRFSPRVGNAPRYLYLPDEAVFETVDNDGVDRFARRLRRVGPMQMVHRIENRLGLVLATAVLTALIVVGAFTHGVPWMARAVAHALPPHIADELSRKVLSDLDGWVLHPSEMTPAEKRRWRAVFQPMIDVSDVPLQVEFRDSPRIGPNAMALPDGTIIFTDALVNLAEEEAELAAILAHEIGHVAHRHGMQGLVQSSLTLWLVVMITGDLAAVSESAVLGPAALINLAYSREREREADDYALEMMRALGIDPIHFANIMQRLSSAPDPVEENTADETTDWGEEVKGYLSTHPAAEERVQRFRDASSQ